MSMIDRDALARTYHKDPKLFAELLDLFCEHLPGLQERFDDAIAFTNCSEIRESAHVMKSRLRHLQICKLGDSAAEIEELGKCGNLEDIEKKYAEMKSGIAEAIDELRAHLNEVAP